MPTRTDKTCQQYLIRAALLRKKAFTEQSNLRPELYKGRTKLDPLEIVDWLEENRKNGIYSKSTFRTYKSSLLHYFETLPNDTVNKEEATNKLRNAVNDGSPKTKIKRTSSRKLKSFKGNDLMKLLKWLHENEKKSKDKSKPKPKWNGLCALWILSTVHTGLRPSEWEHATLVDYNIMSDGQAIKRTKALRVLNGKNSNGRANGNFRTIILAHLSKEDLILIKGFLSQIKLMIDKKRSFEKIQKCCRNEIFFANKKAFPRRKYYYSLYTARHQFSANMKASGFSKSEVAALMGHSSAQTATMHYARAGKGGVVPGVVVNQTEVSTVKTTTLDRNMDSLKTLKSIRRIKKSF